VNDNGVMASNGDFIYGRVASREAVEAMMEKNQSCFLVHFVVRARSFPKINTFLVLGSLDSVEKRNAPTTKWGRDEKDLWAKLSVSVGLVDFSFYNFEIHPTSLFPSLCSIVMVLSFIVKDKSTCFLSLKYHVTFYALLLNDVKCQHNAWSHQSS
jgi:hypothetical protein